jgi:uncharacterized protein (DUF58 family)
LHIHLIFMWSRARHRLHYLLTHDFTPGVNRYVYWLKSPLGALLLAAAASGLCGLFVAPQAGVITGALLLVVGLGMAWPWAGLRGLSCELTAANSHAREGSAIQVTLVIHNRWPWPVWGLALEGGFHPAAVGADPTAVALARVPGWSRTEFTWDFVPACRGVYPQARPRLATEFPFGLWKAARPVDAWDEWIVWPRTFPLSELPLPAGRQWAAATPTDRRVGDDGERLSVRDFRQGDGLRNIHWIQTARLDRLVVSERQGSARARVRLRLNLDPSVHAGEGADGSLEWSVRIAASIGEHFLRLGTAVTLDAGGQRLEIAPGEPGVRRLLDGLARGAFAATSALPARAARPYASLGGRKGDEERFAVTTDRDPWVEGSHARAIVLVTAGFATGESARRQLAALEPWIAVIGPNDAPARVARGWRAQAREVWHGA